MPSLCPQPFEYLLQEEGVELAVLWGYRPFLGEHSQVGNMHLSLPDAQA